MAETRVAYALEMRSPTEVIPAAPAAGVALKEVGALTDERCGELKAVHDLIGAPHGWSSVAWSAERWAALAREPGRRHRWIVDSSGHVGYLCLRRKEDDVEIEIFGLVPGVIGRGYGGHALTLALGEAWRAGIGESEPRRVFVHTSSSDHAHALANYRSRGFLLVETMELGG